MEILSIKGVNKSFKKKSVLQGANLFVNQGEILGLVGPSGSGKSVLSKILIGFLTPDSGERILIKGPKIGFSMQNNSIYSDLNVKQNLRYFSKLQKVRRRERKSRIEELIRLLGLKEFEKVLVKNLSGGTAKRVDIACALLTDPEIVLFDEPFLGLDPKLIENLSRIMLYLNRKGKTILISSHRVEELTRICSRFVLIKNKIVRQIDKKQLIKAYD